MIVVAVDSGTLIVSSSIAGFLALAGTLAGVILLRRSTHEANEVEAKAVVIQQRASEFDILRDTVDFLSNEVGRLRAENVETRFALMQCRAESESLRADVAALKRHMRTNWPDGPFPVLRGGDD